MTTEIKNKMSETPSENIPLPAVTIRRLQEEIHEYRKIYYGEMPEYINLSVTDGYNLEAEMYNIGSYSVVADRVNGMGFRFMGIRVLRSMDVKQGEVILSRSNGR